MKAVSVLSVFVWFCTGAYGGAAWTPQSQDWGKISREFIWENERIEGRWKESQKWDSWACEGYYAYASGLSARVADLNLELTDAGHLIARVTLSHLHAATEAKYRSKATACLPLSGWLGVGSPWAQLESEVHFGQLGDLSDVRLRLRKTELGRLEFGGFFPAWFEAFFTGVINRAMAVVWSTNLGDWLSERISHWAKQLDADG